ncbi:hypothetical protein B0J11DRAFT_565350 [Dendryphion nanum]|uniref:Uncharacterized protein n=1 Tax=Dendryphion nanum TaxID=256645 RepID=A0A9P9EFF4_9PLEO|nr:hypothetical protein B0J11DRAFT_565350 [Dendryphion nanum]
MPVKDAQGSIDVKQNNVFEKPLHKHSTNKKDLNDSSSKSGFCNEQASIAATLTNGFLDFSASNGLDLRPKGVEAGDKLCLGASAWKQAVDKGAKDVPNVNLGSTHLKALDTIGLKDLQKFAVDADMSGQAQNTGKEQHFPEKAPGTGKVARESSEIGGKEPKA